MNKIRLNVDELKVASFATADVAESSRGTVRAREYSVWEDSCRQACFQQSHEFDTCGQTGPTCGATCDCGCNSVHVCQSDRGGCG